MIKRCVFLSLLALVVATSSSYADGGVGGSGYSARFPSSDGATGDDQGIGNGRAKGTNRGVASDRAMAKRIKLGQAGQEDTTEAIARYARARSLIIAALHEFDKARKIASPSELLDPVEWRNTLIDRAEDLDRVLDPQPRATKGGIKFEADPRLLPEASR